MKKVAFFKCKTKTQKITVHSTIQFMSDLVGNAEERFSYAAAHVVLCHLLSGSVTCRNLFIQTIYEPSCEKTNNVVSEQVGHKSGCTVTEADYKLEIAD